MPHKCSAPVKDEDERRQWGMNAYKQSKAKQNKTVVWNKKKTRKREREKEAQVCTLYKCSVQPSNAWVNRKADRSLCPLPCHRSLKCLRLVFFTCFRRSKNTHTHTHTHRSHFTALIRFFKTISFSLLLLLSFFLFFPFALQLFFTYYSFALYFRCVILTVNCVK